MVARNIAISLLIAIVFAASSFAQKPFPPVPQTLEQELEAGNKDLLPLLKQKKFAELETIAAGYRRDRPVTSNGMPKLEGFYRWIEIGELELPRDEFLALLNTWKASDPKSITPRVALIRTYLYFAGQSRGSGTAGTVKEREWLGMRKWLELAVAELNDARPLATDDPDYYSNAILAAKLDGGPMSRAEEAFRKGVAIDPGYLALYYEYSYFLEPFWFGEIGDELKLADEAANLTSEKYGQEMYARIAGNVSHQLEAMNRPSSPFALGFEWSRVKQGYRDALRRYPDSFRLTIQFLAMASMAKDDDTARELVDRIGSSRNAEIERFVGSYELDRIRARVLAPKLTREAWSLSDPADWPRMVGSNAVDLEYGVKVRRGNAFLIRDGNGGINGVTSIAIFRRAEERTNVTPDDVGTMVKSWTLARTSTPLLLGKPRKLAKIDNDPNEWLVLDVSNKKPPLVPLQLRTKPVEFWETMYVVEASAGKQLVHPCEVASWNLTRSGITRSLSLTCAVVIDGETMAGAPVLDAEGHVAGMVLRSGSAGTVMKRDANGQFGGTVPAYDVAAVSYLRELLKVSP